jgi:predicted nucleotidyltransferase
VILSALEGPAVRVYLFGSSVTGGIRRASDIDVAIEPRGALSPALLAKLREQLEESDIPYDVDIVDLSTTSAEFKARVLREGILWKG